MSNPILWFYSWYEYEWMFLRQTTDVSDLVEKLSTCSVITFYWHKHRDKEQEKEMFSLSLSPLSAAVLLSLTEIRCTPDCPCIDILTGHCSPHWLRKTGQDDSAKNTEETEAAFLLCNAVHITIVSLQRRIWTLYNNNNTMMSISRVHWYD